MAVPSTRCRKAQAGQKTRARLIRFIVGQGFWWSFLGRPCPASSISASSTDDKRMLTVH